jgi:hypothetical protein
MNVIELNKNEISEVSGGVLEFLYLTGANVGGCVGGSLGVIGFNTYQRYLSASPNTQMSVMASFDKTTLQATASFYAMGIFLLAGVAVYGVYAVGSNIGAFVGWCVANVLSCEID